MLTTIVIKIDWALRVSGSGYVGARRVCHKCWPCEGKGSRLECLKEVFGNAEGNNELAMLRTEGDELIIMSSLLQLGEAPPALLVVVVVVVAAVLVVLAAAALAVVVVVVLEVEGPEHELQSRRRVARRSSYDRIP